MSLITALTTAPDQTTHSPAPYYLCFPSLFQMGRSFAFPCSASGQVDMPSLSHRTRDNYLFARAMVGRELQTPFVKRADCVHKVLATVPCIQPNTPPYGARKAYCVLGCYRPGGPGYG